MYSPDHLWSPYGIRSLSATHPLFGQGENYWRGPIWVQMNYLALSVLHKVSLGAGMTFSLTQLMLDEWDQRYAAEPGPYQDLAKKIYTELRENVVKNVQKVRR